MRDAFSKIFKNKQRVLVVMSHPDDAEIYCGGTIARLIAQGKQVRMIKMTLGNKGSRQEKISESKLRQVREQEDTAAARVLGVKPKDNIYFKLEDGGVDLSMKTIEKLAKEIRTFRPELIITHNPEDLIIRYAKNENWFNHRDHRHTGQMVIDASYPYSRDILFFPQQLKDKRAQSHAVTEFLLVDYWAHPDLVGIDITNYHAVRTQAHACHASQYSKEKAQTFTDWLCKQPNGTYRERFRYVIAD